MSLQSRRILYSIFIIIFLLVAPILLLYTSGYRWNSYKNQIEKIGNLVIKTIPKKVTIQIGDIKTEKITPWRFNNLIPNEYLVTVSQPDFHSWQKKLNVRSGETTFAEHIFLFMKNVLSENILPQVTFWQYNKKLNVILYQQNEKLYLYNLLNDQTEKLFYFDQKIENISWSANNQNLFITTTDDVIFLNLQNNKDYYSLNNTLKYKNYKCKLSNTQDNAILCQNEYELFKYNFIAKSKNLLLKETNGTLIDFYLSDNKIYYLQKKSSDNNIYLKIKHENKTEALNPDYQLPNNLGYEFIRIKNNKVTILDKSNKKLYILSLFDEEDAFNKTSRIISDVENVFYVDDNTFVYFNNWEVWTDINGSSQLITRQSDKIKNVLWHKSNNYLSIISSGSIKMIELDSRDNRNSAEILKKSHIENASFDKQAKYIIFSLQNSKTNTQNIFKIQILPTNADF